MKSYPLLLLVLALLGLTAAPFTLRAESSAWMEDYQAALAQAAKEKKQVFLLFTGSAWCPPCKMMERDVFSKPEFLDYAAKNLVLVMLDFSPDGKSKSKAFGAAQEALAQKFAIEGFPTYILTDASGKVLARNMGYVPGGPEAIIRWIKSAN